MTEAEWLASGNPASMILPLLGKVSARKLRLFACACVYRIWHLLPLRRSRTTVTVAERAADGLVNENKLRAAWEKARRTFDQPRCRQDGQALVACMAAAAAAHAEAGGAAVSAAGYAASTVANAAVPGVRPAILRSGEEADRWSGALHAEKRWQADLLRDLFPRGVHRASGGSVRLLQDGGVVVTVAQAIYDDRRFEDL